MLSEEQISARAAALTGTSRLAVNEVVQTVMWPQQLRAAQGTLFTQFFSHGTTFTSVNAVETYPE